MNIRILKRKVFLITLLIILGGFVVLFSFIKISQSSNQACTNILEEDLIGTSLYYYESLSALNAQLELKSDNKVLFRGWKSKEFISKGTWLYNQNQQSITLTFTDETEFWKRILSKESLDIVKKTNSSVINVKEQPYPSITTKFMSKYNKSTNTCNVSINIMNYIFNGDVILNR